MEQKPSLDPFNRYAKQIKVSQIGQAGQEQLQQLELAIIGVGALGSVIAEQLVRAGVGKLRIIDRDFVEQSNLHRQVIYSEQDAQQFLPKAIVAKRYLEQVNSHILIDAYTVDVNPHNIEELLQGVDLIIDGTDNFAVRYLLNDYSVAHRIPWIYGAVVGTSGSTATFIPDHTPCYACLFPVEPEFGATETCDTAGVISPIVHMIASIQATEAIKIATNQQQALHHNLIQLDCWSNDQLKIDISTAKRKDCPVCAKKRFHYLKSNEQPVYSSMLCGRNSVQVTPATHSVSIDQLQKYYAAHYEISRNAYLLKLTYSNEVTIVFFPDGRAIVQGTNELQWAESIVAKLVHL